MKTKTMFKIVLPTLAMLVSSALHAAEKPVAGGNTVSVEVTPKLYLFDYYKGVGSDRTQFLERYNYQASGSDNRSGFYPDGDLSILVTNPQRDLFSLERLGFGIYNQRGKAKLDMEKFGVNGYYSMFRSATGGIDFLYSPNQVPGGTDSSYFPIGSANTDTGYVAQFNDDSNGQTRYKIDRTTYGGGFALKPELFRNLGSFTFNYDGYQREGNRFATYVLGGSDVTGGATRVLQRWRGFDMPVDEQMNRFSVNFSGTPGGFQLAYDGSVEKFNNQASDFTVGNFAPLSSGFISSTNIKPIHFVPDSTLLTNNFRVTKTFGLTTVAGGYGLSVLDQDSFTPNQRVAGYNTGEIMTNSAFLNINSAVLSWVGLEGYAKYYHRDNDSTFPAIGLIDAAVNQQLGVRINMIESFTYGLSATFRPHVLKSTVTVGWKGEDKDRDLTWSEIPSALNAIQPQRSLYRQETFSNEGYINWVARPLDGLIIRVTPSYQYAHNTGLITEPSESFNLKTRINYAINDITSVSGYYNFKNRENDNNSYTDALTLPVRDGPSLEQNTDNTQQASGFSLSFTPNEKLSTTASFGWMRNDFDSYFISSNRRRFEAPNGTVLFRTRDTPNYLVDTYVFSVGADLQATKKLGLSGGYTLSHAKGHNATGYIEDQLQISTGAIDEQVDNTLQTFSFGADYAFNKKLKIKGSYAYDYYNDKVYSLLTGGYHTVMLGASLGF
jgi:hypothetical protein